MIHSTVIRLWLGTSLWCVALLGMQSSVYAAPNVIPMTVLSTVHPPGGQVGQTVEVTVNGAFLDDPRALVFNHAGIRAVSKSPGGNQYTVTIDKDVPPGNYEVRVVACLGISNSRMFHVGTEGEILEPGANAQLAVAPVIELGQAIHGKNGCQCRGLFQVQGDTRPAHPG